MEDTTAQCVIDGGELGIQRLARTTVHVQCVPKNQMFSALSVFELENQNGSVGDFQQDQNDARISHLRGAIEQFNEQSTDLERLRNEHAAHDLLEEEIEARGGTVTDDGRISGPKEVTDEFIDHEEAKEILEKDLPSKSELKDQKKRIEESLSEELEQVALTENQRDKLDVGVETGLLGTLTEKSAFSLLKSISPIFGKGGQLTWNVVKENWGKIDGDIVERAIKLREELLDEVVKDWTPESNEDPTGARPN
ncbi:hypothetical protein [Natrinema amylolyticum]|uniref:hypothetical protein n=1 Tax=Natrinema amylolyticum TaxID=2878679 RepID=UPI001CFBA85D|nr:hypothetical protein [Natrinema amylolyticum]